MIGVCKSLVSVSLSVQVLLVPSVFDVDGKSFWDQESEPLKGLGIETGFGERVLPVWDSQVHDHKSEVVSK